MKKRIITFLKILLIPFIIVLFYEVNAAVFAAFASLAALDPLYAFDAILFWVPTKIGHIIFIRTISYIMCMIETCILCMGLF